MKKDEELDQLKEQVHQLEKLFQQEAVTPTPGGFYLNRRSRSVVTVGLLLLFGLLGIWEKQRQLTPPTPGTAQNQLHLREASRFLKQLDYDKPRLGDR